MHAMHVHWRQFLVGRVGLNAPDGWMAKYGCPRGALGQRALPQLNQKCYLCSDPYPVSRIPYQSSVISHQSSVIAHPFALLRGFKSVAELSCQRRIHTRHTEGQRLRFCTRETGSLDQRAHVFTAGKLLNSTS